MARRTEEEVISFIRDFSPALDESGQRNLNPRRRTILDEIRAGEGLVTRYTNEFWTSRQRQANRLHEISYRACFKPQLPAFFIGLLTSPGDRVYDPFSGRGTTAIEAGLLGRRVAANDVNPLSRIITKPRLTPPDLAAIRSRLLTIGDTDTGDPGIDLTMFYHPDTLRVILSLRTYLLEREADGTLDTVDEWIRMVATNRLTGHSSGFFSVYTLPPNQAVSPDRQIRINELRNQTPPYRDVREIILKKSRSLLQGLDTHHRAMLKEISGSAIFSTADARVTPEIPDASIRLTVTSPPFLDVVQYAGDNWLRCWFNGLDAAGISSRITMSRRLADWEAVMGSVFSELWRVTMPDGWVAFEVGEVRKGSVRLDEHVVPLGEKAGFTCVGIVVNRQDFTKTANIWGVENMNGGTNSNRIVLFHREPEN